MDKEISEFILTHLSEIISAVVGGLVGCGVTLHFTKNVQKQRSGDNSHNYQSGRDVNVGKE